MWVLHWRYSDGSASGVIDRLITDEQKKLLEYVLLELGETSKDWNFVKVQVPKE